MHIRLATQSDIVEATELYMAVLRESPINQLFFADTTDEDYRVYRQEKISLSIQAKSKNVLVAVHDEGMLIGVVIYNYHGMMDQAYNDDKPFTLKPPAGTNVPKLEAYEEKQMSWMNEMLATTGAHIRGETLNVIKYERNVGVATALCLAVAKEAAQLKLPVFFDTTYYSFPFYDRFADMQRFTIKYYGHIHHKTGPVAVTSYLVQLIPKEKEEKYKESRGKQKISRDQRDHW